MTRPARLISTLTASACCCAAFCGIALPQAYGEEVVRYSVMKGTRYETPYYVKTAAAPGPTIIVIGGVHGDETAGYLAARKIAKWTVTRGRLIVMPDAHREAIRRNTRGYPGNMNNMFPGKANGDVMERLAFEIWQVITKYHPDFLLTLHESRDFHARDPSRYGQTFCFDFPELVPRMTRAMNLANKMITAKPHRFVILVAPFPHCPTYNAWSRLRIPATSIETSRTLPLARRVRYQLLATQAFFDDYKLGYRQSDAPRLSPELIASALAGAETPPVSSQIPAASRAASPSDATVGATADLVVPTNVAPAATTAAPKDPTPILALWVLIPAGLGALLGYAGWRLGRKTRRIDK